MGERNVPQLSTARKPKLEGGAVHAGIASGVPCARERAVVAQQCVQLASEAGLKAGDMAILDEHPFRVRAGKTQDVTAPGELRVLAECADDLRFLTTHDIRSAARIGTLDAGR